LFLSTCSPRTFLPSGTVWYGCSHGLRWWMLWPELAWSLGFQAFFTAAKVCVFIPSLPESSSLNAHFHILC
jgi:hypothetical protein